MFTGGVTTTAMACCNPSYEEARFWWKKIAVIFWKGRPLGPRKGMSDETKPAGPIVRLESLKLAPRARKSAKNM